MEQGADAARQNARTSRRTLPVITVRTSRVDVMHQVIALHRSAFSARQVNSGGVVDQNINAAEGVHRRLDRCSDLCVDASSSAPEVRVSEVISSMSARSQSSHADLFLRADIALHSQRLATSLLDLFSSGVDGARQARVLRDGLGDW